MEELAFALDTFYAVMAGALVMFMAAGFTMLEAGLVQKKDVSEITWPKRPAVELIKIMEEDPIA